MGGVKLGVKQLDSQATVNTASTTNGKYYPVGANKDGKLIVNVPWTDNSHYIASIIAGATGSTVNAATTENDDTYIHILDKNDGTVISNTKIKIVGDGSVKISSDNSGNITISGEQYRVQKPRVTVDEIKRNGSGYYAGNLSFKDNAGVDVEVKVYANGQDRGAAGASFNLSNLNWSALTSNTTKSYFIPFFPIGRTDIMPGLVKLTIRCTATTQNNETTYLYTATTLTVL